jgi:hypothetical protein
METPRDERGHAPGFATRTAHRRKTNGAASRKANDVQQTPRRDSRKVGPALRSSRGRAAGREYAGTVSKGDSGAAAEVRRDCWSTRPPKTTGTSQIAEHQRDAGQDTEQAQADHRTGTGVTRSCSASAIANESRAPRWRRTRFICTVARCGDGAADASYGCQDNASVPCVRDCARGAAARRSVDAGSPAQRTHEPPKQNGPPASEPGR